MSSRISDFFATCEIEKIAKATEFVKRKSKFKAWMFVETLMFHFQSQKKLSLTDLCNDISLAYRIKLRKQSLDHRFSASASKFLKCLLKESITKLMSKDQNLSVFNYFKRVKIKDSTSFELPDNMKNIYPGNGGFSSAACMRIQFEYDVKSNIVTDLSLHSQKESDYQEAHDTINDIQQGDLIIRDLGYIAIDILKDIDKLKAFFLNRIKPATGIYERKDDTYIPISLKSITRVLRKTGKTCYEKKLYIGRRKYLPCRVIFMLVPEDKRKERKKRQLKKSVRRGSKPDQRVIDNTDLNIFITNVPTDIIPAPEIYNVYKLRWQIELVFKTWKQVCKINHIKSVKPNRVESIIYAQLLWITVNWSIVSAFIYLFFRLGKGILSIYKSFKTMKLISIQLRFTIRDKNKLGKIIGRIGNLLSENHFKEKRKGRIFSTDIVLVFRG